MIWGRNKVESSDHEFGPGNRPSEEGSGLGGWMRALALNIKIGLNQSILINSWKNRRFGDFTSGEVLPWIGEWDFVELNCWSLLGWFAPRNPGEPALQIIDHLKYVFSLSLSPQENLQSASADANIYKVEKLGKEVDERGFWPEKCTNSILLA
jgi:hypothetical protein